MITVEAATPEAAAPMRAGYLDRLIEPQELFSEFQNRGAEVWLLEEGGRPAGYAFTKGEVITEFHAVDRTVSRQRALLEALVRGRGLTGAFCKTFDLEFLALCLERARRTRIEAILFRDLVDPGFQPRPDVSVRPGRPGEAGRVLEINDGFFSGEAQIDIFLNRGGARMFEIDGELVGVGVVTEVVAGRGAYDIGMLVAPGRRRQGLGQYIIRCLKAEVLERGGRPICGCHVDNAASRATLERAGFRSRHRIVEFGF